MTTRDIVRTEDAPQALGAYSQAVIAGGFIFVSGQIALAPDSGELVSDDVGEQTTQVLRNIEAILSAAGAAMSNVVQSTIYMTDMSDFAAVNEVYRGHFPTAPPARATVAVAQLPRDALVEIAVVALAEQG